jgi:hypothetical protein
MQGVALLLKSPLSAQTPFQSEPPSTRTMRCPCGYDGPSLEAHYSVSKHCRPVEPQPSSQQKSGRFNIFELFKRRLRNLFVREVSTAHFDRYVSEAHLDHMMKEILLTAIEFILLYLVDASDIRQGCAEVRQALHALPSASVLIDQTRRACLRIEPLTFKNESSSDRNGAIFFSFIQVLTVFLQESKPSRQHCRASSERWKTGELYQQTPVVYDDVTSSRVFRNNAQMCKKATAEQARDFRVAAQVWTDEYTTVDGLSVYAGNRKYGIVLGALINLPLYMRHYVDNLLLLMLYSSKYAKKHGGLSRMLTGIAKDGTVHRDGLNLSLEVDLGKSTGTMIELPSDSDDQVEPELWNLRFSIIMISLDWLATGDFGPFAASVSARYPCFKCMFTTKCACAYQPRAVAATMTHAPECRGCAPRTHEGVMDAVRELRALSATEAKKQMTELGVYSLYFASEHILNDVVVDTTVDIMHAFYCGLARYMLSWLTDILCPDDFTFEALNGRKNDHRFKLGVRVPDLERAKSSSGKPRGSCTIKLSAAATMAFSLARYACYSWHAWCRQLTAVC